MHPSKNVKRLNCITELKISAMNSFRSMTPVKQTDTNRFKTIFSVVSEAHVKKLLTFRRCECLTIASAMSSFFNDEQFICSDLASVLSSITGKQPTASWTLLSSVSDKQTQSPITLYLIGV